MWRLPSICRASLFFVLTSALGSYTHGAASLSALPGPVSICFDSGCQNCTTKIEATPDQIGEYPECIDQSSSILEDQGYLSPSGDQDGVAYISVPEPRAGCVFLVYVPTSIGSDTCGAASVYAEHAGCYFAHLSSNFSLQTCCDAQRCGHPFSQKHQESEQWDTVFEKVAAIEAHHSLEMTNNDGPQPTPLPALELRNRRRSWQWPWNQPVTVAAAAPTVPPSAASTAPIAAPTSIMSPASSVPRLNCVGPMKLVSPAVETEGSQIRVGSDINCLGSNNPCAQAQSISVRRGFVLFVLGLPGASYEFGLGVSFEVNVLLIWGSIPNYSVITEVTSSLTIPPGSRGVLTWTPFYRCAIVTAEGCDQGVKNATIRACQPVLDAAKRAVGEYRVVTLG